MQTILSLCLLSVCVPPKFHLTRILPSCSFIILAILPITTKTVTILLGQFCIICVGNTAPFEEVLQWFFDMNKYLTDKYFDIVWG